MGARPEFLLNSLRFGPIVCGDDETQMKANRRLFAGVVAGIAHYGNCIGVPTIGGEIYFDKSFEGNPLVNVFCLGVLRHEQLARGAARGIGNPVFYVGAETGRDGLAGAAFASRELTEESREDRPAVQVGDPFKEKLLLEACLELLARDAVAGIQDMGAAGLTCSTCETASRGGTGIEIDLAKVPKRESGMTPYEILLSESQERMLIIAKRGQENVVREVFEKWDVTCAEIGRVTDDGMMRVRNNGTVAAEIPAKPLAEEAPLYSREAKAPRTEDTKDAKEFLKSIPFPSDSSVDVVSFVRLLAAIAARAVDRLEKLGLSAIRSHGPHRHGCLAGIRCGGFSRARSEQNSGRDDRLQFALLPARSARRRPHRRRGGGAQSHLLRRETARGDGQFEFRKSLQTGNFLATARSGRGCSGSLPRVRHAGHRRQRLFI